MGAIRVILADDHAVVRKGIREFLEEERLKYQVPVTANLRIYSESSFGVMYCLGDEKSCNVRNKFAWEQRERGSSREH